jgi:hypothetical protein
MSPNPHGWRNRLLILVGAAAALIAVAWIVVAIAFPPPRVRALVQKQLGAMLRREVRFDDARIGIFPPVRLEVKGLALADPRGFAEGTTFGARAIDLDLDVGALLVRRFVVRRLILDEPRLHLVLHANGTTNLDSLGQPPEVSAPRSTMELAMKEIDLRHGQILVDDYAAKRRISLGLDSRTSLALENRGASVTTEGESKIRDLAFGSITARSKSDLNQGLAKVELDLTHRGSFDLDAKRLKLDRLVLHLGRAEVALAGTMDLGSDPKSVNFESQGHDVDLGDVLGYLSVADAKALNGIKGAGRLRFDLAFRGALGPNHAPPVIGTLAIEDGSFHYPETPVGLEKTSFEARIAPDSLTVTRLSALVQGQPVGGEIAVAHFADPRVRFAIHGNLELAAVSRFVAPKDTRLEGRAALDLKGEGRAKDPGAIDLEGWARLSNVSATTPQLPKKIEGVNGEIDFSRARAQVKGLSARAGQSSFTIDANVARPLAVLAKIDSVPPARVEFNFASPYLDLAELLPPVPGGPMLANARGGGKVSIGRLRNKKLDVKNVLASVELEPGVVAVREYSFAGYGGTAKGTARFDYRNVRNPVTALEATLDQAKAEELLGTWTGAGKLFHGILSTNLGLSFSGNDPPSMLRSLTGKGVAAFANGILGPTPLLESIAAFTHVPDYKEVRFKNLSLPFKVENGRVATGPAKFTGPYGDWLVSGTTRFDGELDYAATVSIPQEAVAKIGSDLARIAAPLADDQGHVMLDLRIAGPARAPRVSLDREAMQGRLLAGASKALKIKVPSALAPLLPGGASSDSAGRAQVKQAQHALEDTLKKEANKFLKGLFGKAPKDTGARSN